MRYEIYCTDIFVLPLPDGHPFPMPKYKLLREKLVQKGVAQESQFIIPHAATDEELTRAHDPGYVQRVTTVNG